MSLAVLFSFHRRPDTCLDRVRLLRRLNPGLPILGLFGGDHSLLPQFSPLQELLDSCYVHPPAPAEWLWRNYDKVICRWFEDCGKDLEWDFLFVHAWDLLLVEPLAGYAAGLEQDQVLLPGVRPLELMDQDVADPRRPPRRPGNWDWLRRAPQDLWAFKQYLSAVFGRAPRLFCEVSPFAVLSRAFCGSYHRVAAPIPGFNEYRFPTMVPLLGYRFADRELPANFWSFYNAEKVPVREEAVREELARPGGARLFHPVYDPVAL